MDAPHLRIAVTTNSLIQVDANFAAARQVVFYDVARESSEFVDVIHFGPGGLAKKGPGGGLGKELGTCIMDDMEDDDGTGRDPLVDRVDALKGCSVLFTLGLSDLAAFRVHAMKIFPVKSATVRDIDEVISNVQRLMNGVPPLWMRRVMRDAAGLPMALDEQEV